MKIKTKSLKLQQLLIGAFLILAIAVAYFIFKMAKDSKYDWVHNRATNAMVVDVFDGYKGKPNYRKMKLSDSQFFVIPKQMINVVQIGDSVLKYKDSTFYIFTQKATGKKLRIDNW